MTQPDGASNPLQDPKFYKFISKAVPMLEAELDAAIRSRAFDGYELLDTELDTQIRKLHTLDATSTRTQNEGRSNEFGIYKSNELYFFDNV